MIAQEMKVEETWAPLEPNDVVFSLPTDGNVVAFQDKVRGMFGAIVRLRDGVYQKCMLPLKIINGDYVKVLLEQKSFRRGSELIEMVAKLPKS